MSETPPQAYISKVHLKGYKSIRDLEIDFKPGLNIIIGPNGSGKTNFLEFLEKVFQLKLDTESSAEALLHLENEYYNLNYTVTPDIQKNQPKGVKSFIVNVNIKNSKGQIEFERNFLKIDNREIDKSRVDVGNDNIYYALTNEWKFFDNNGSDKKIHYLRYGVSDYFRERLSNPFNIEPNHLRLSGVDFISPDYSTDLMLFRIIDIDNLKIVKNKVKKITIKKDLLNILKYFSPIEDIVMDTEYSSVYIDDDELNINFVWLKFSIKNTWLNWNMLSDGTQRIFYLLINVYCSTAQYIFIEEPELGIHPDQLYKLMDFLKEQSKEKQIIITTHSPEVLSILNKDEIDRIIVTRYDAEKGTQMHHLSPAKIRKAQIYIEETGDLSSFWVHSNLEEYDAEETED
jgi:predicted ATP-dependent endonuclease of OLD family